MADASLSFTRDPAEWTGTDITFDISRDGERTEVRFSHRGLVPEFECFDSCSNAWGYYVNSSLRNLITDSDHRTTTDRGGSDTQHS